MDMSSVFTNQLPLARTVFLAWLTAAFIHVQWGVAIRVSDVSPLDFTLQAGLLFGYFTALMAFGRLLAFLVLMLISLLALALTAEAPPPIPGPSSIDRLRADPLYSTFLNRGGPVLANVAYIAAMFSAFLLYSASLLRALAPIGLVLALIFFALGGINNTVTRDRPPEGSGAA